jgi:hypothetical protein
MDMVYWNSAKIRIIMIRERKWIQSLTGLLVGLGRMMGALKSSVNPANGSSDARRAQRAENKNSNDSGLHNSE